MPPVQQASGREHRIPKSPAVWLAVTVMGSLFMAQTLPQAFVTQLLPTIYREQGLPLNQFWVFSLLLAPSYLRWLWAPLVDRHGSERFGRRRSWVLPSTGFATVAYLVLLFITPTIEHLPLAVGILLVQTLAITTQEVAVDAYVVEGLRPEERGLGAGVRVMMEALAELVALLALTQIYDRYGWSAAVVFGAAFLILFTAPILARREAPVMRLPQDEASPRASVQAFIRRRDALLIGLNLAACGLAFGIYLPMLGPFLIDRGFEVAEVGQILAGVIVGGMLLGSLGGILLSARLAPRHMMMIAGGMTPLAFGAPVLLVNATAATAGTAVACLLGTAVLLAFFNVTLNIARMGWAVGSQAGTDYAIATGILKAGMAGGLTVGGLVAGTVGWAWFFPINGMVVATAAMLFVVSLAPIAARAPNAASGAPPPT